MIAIDLGHRFGRVARVGPDGLPEVTTTRLAGADGVLDPVRALPLLIGSAPAGEGGHGAEPDRTAALGLPVSGGREDELRYAVERSGLEVGRVVPEPVAVALHYGAVAQGVDHTVLVCDQGATTLDLSVLAVAPDLTVHVVRCLSLHLGGDDWDAAVAAELAGRLPDGVDPLGAAEVLRRALGDSDTVTEAVEDAEGGRHALTLDRSDFERAVTPLRERLLAAVAEQLGIAEPAVDTVLLAGGMGAEPGLRTGIEALPAAQGLTVRCDRPELAVVLGLLELRDFGVLRVVTGSAGRPPRAEAGYRGRDSGYAGRDSGYPRTESGRPGGDTRYAAGPEYVDTLLDPEPAGAPTDPEPRTGRPPVEDPEPAPRQGGGPAGQEDAFAPSEPEAAVPQPHAEPPHAPYTESAHAPYDEPPYAEPRYAEFPYAESPAAGPASADAPGSPEESPPPPPSAHHPGPDPHREPEPGPEPRPDPDSPASPRSDPYDLTDEDPPRSPVDPRILFAVPVGQLQAVRRGDHLLVLWAWPEGALSARVRWRREGNTAGAAAGAGDTVCRRRVYEHDGGFDLTVGNAAVTLTVEALVADLGEDCEGASSLLVPAAPTVVSYEPSVRRRLKGRVATVTFTSEDGCDLPGLRIVHSLGRFRPTSTAEGTVLHEVPAQRLSAATPLTVEFPLPATRGPSWLVCFPAHADAGTDLGIDIRPTALHRLRVT
ncbi:Hsp70 family protein [Streptomyces sp. G1]|uniref:Hsp70 family protein n=1 Tax=Streptomyces sp. G1 TaxID=361572 RepID=UPI00202FE6D2|nr:Hsp70 family protein [Streptomyces sp. G1]MCM1971810.1 Hsp70 family protein [Streptomyces sp. G1]